MSVLEAGIRQHVIFVHFDMVYFDKFTFGNLDADIETAHRCCSDGGVAQWSSRPPTEQKIPGSNPPGCKVLKVLYVYIAVLLSNCLIRIVIVRI
jgi:hypothetical protein